MTLKLSERADIITQSEIRIMSVECERVGGVNLSQGVCDTEIPLSVRRAAQEAIERGVNTYTRLEGLIELRRAIAGKLARYNGLLYDPETEIIVSAGATGGFYCACLALLNPGDEVILFEPYYGYHLNTLLAVSAIPTYVTLKPPDWTFPARDLEAVVTPRTRGIVINTPANPSGKVFTRTELELIADFANRHDLFVFTDEIYEHFLFDRRQHVSPACLPGMRQRTITVSGASKTFSITGWRIGWSACSKRWTPLMGALNDLVYICAPAPLQAGVAAGLEKLGPDYYESLIQEYAVKRDKICEALSRAKLTPFIPQGAYYVLADVSCIPGTNSKQRAMYLLEQTGVASVPGSAFYHGSDGEELARFCFAKKDEDLDRACRQLEEFRV
jgi:aminotransferase